MAKVSRHHPTVIRTERGLSVAGTRVTLYDVMDYVTAGWPPKLIRDRLNLTDQQVTDVMEYIDAHRPEVEAEYQHVLQEAEDARRYWEDLNRDRFERLAATPVDPDRKHLRAKLEEWKSRLDQTR
jgi:uncharacterized protein (DUF433 family)